MDSAYDHIQEESYPDDPASKQQQSKDKPKAESSDFNSEIQDAYRAISSSPWAARLGGFLGSVKKQGEQLVDNASKQLPVATASLSSVTSHIRTLTVQSPGSSSSDPTTTTTGDASSSGTTAAEKRPHSPEAHPDRPESLPADIVKEAESMLMRFRSEAAKRLKDIEKAEDAADEALLKFGANIRNFLKEAVTIAPPSDANGNPSSSSNGSNKVLFESKDSEGKRVIHTTRFDAQLHVIHSSIDSFLRDPVSPEWENFKKSFDVGKKTEAIAKDLEKHGELRRAMEKCVPERVEYAVFWCRYYFLRWVIESEEQRRREMLKASAPINEEEIAWDDDSSDSEEEEDDEDEDDEKDEEDEEDSEDSEDDSDDDSDDSPTTPNKTPAPTQPPTTLSSSKETLKPTTDPATPITQDTLKPLQPRRSNDEKSVADSDASYDLVSGATSRAPGSPMEKERKKVVVEESESDEEDWE